MLTLPRFSEHHEIWGRAKWGDENAWPIHAWFWCHFRVRCHLIIRRMGEWLIVVSLGSLCQSEALYVQTRYPKKRLRHLPVHDGGPLSCHANHTDHLHILS